MKRYVVVLGAGGHTRSLINLLLLNKYSIEGIYDDSWKPGVREHISDVPVKGPLRRIPARYPIVLSIGDNRLRKVMYLKYRKRMLKANVIHPTAIVEKGSVLGDSNQIFARAYINSQAHIGSNTIINTSAVIEHEATIGSHTHISVGTIVCGRSHVGERCFIGAGAVIIDNISVGNDVMVGAASVVVKPIKKPGVYVGNPSRKLS